MVLMKMLMEIDPLLMRGSLVMMMASISPSGREVPSAKQLRRSPRLVPPRDGDASSQKLSSYFFQGKIHLIPEDGHRRPAGWPTRQGARPGGRVCPYPCGCLVGPLWYFLRPVFFIYSKIILCKFSGLLELCRIGLSDLLLFGLEFQLSAFSLFM